METIDSNIFQHLRKKSRLSLRDAAKQAGISATYLWQIEKDLRKPSAEILKKLAPVYGVPVQDLLKATGYFGEPQIAKGVKKIIAEAIDSEGIHQVTEKELLTISEVASHLRIHKATVCRYIKEGRLKAYTLPGGGYRLRHEDVLKLLIYSNPLMRYEDSYLHSVVFTAPKSTMLKLKSLRKESSQNAE